jgi:hypothetical protein
MTPSPPGLAEQIAALEKAVDEFAPQDDDDHKDFEVAKAILSTLRAHAALEADARRYRKLMSVASFLPSPFLLHGHFEDAAAQFAYAATEHARAAERITAAIDSFLGSK